MKTKAVYAFSGDPITYGHINIIERAAKIFDEVIVAIGQNPAKKYLFSVEERIYLASISLDHLNNVEVKNFSGLFTDFLQKQDTHVHIKGIRNIEDYYYETTLHEIFKSQFKATECILFPAVKEYEHISSSAVKALALVGGNIQSYVPEKIISAIQSKFKVGV